MMHDSHRAGLEGESLACDYLRANGYQVLTTRFRAQGGEIDIIARDGTYLCFIEVKYRPDGRMGTGFTAVTPDKRSRLRLAAHAYLSAHPHAGRMRFDVIEVTRAGVWHWKNAGAGT